MHYVPGVSRPRLPVSLGGRESGTIEGIEFDAEADKERGMRLSRVRRVAGRDEERNVMGVDERLKESDENEVELNGKDGREPYDPPKTPTAQQRE